jgi:hypothetical protein
VLETPDAAIAMADLRGRCVVTTFDPDTLVQDVDVLRGIRADFGGSLALNAWTARDGHVAVGDEVREPAEPLVLPVPAAGRFAA